MNQRRSSGFSYVEAMVAVVLLALMAVPAANAVRNGLDAARITAQKTRELRCMQNKMEAVLAEPYLNLWNAARGPKKTSNPAASVTTYSSPADAGCVERTVRISKYLHKYSASPVFIDFPEESGKEDEREAIMLYITVDSGQTDYTFTTIVSR